jgi:hypothetical protein
LTVALEQAAMSRLELQEEERRPWYCVLDEFQKFVANEGSAQVLAQMLSEVRKMGLRLCLAHQGWHQLGNSRLEGALDQAQVKVIFGSGTKTARVVAEELFTPDPGKIKHEVADPQAQDRTHPHFESLMEQKEMFVQSIHNQGRRQILVLPPEGNQVISLRTLDVPTPKVDPLKLDEVKAGLLSRIGKKIRSADFEESTSLPIHQPSERRIPAASGFVTQ